MTCERLRRALAWLPVVGVPAVPIGAAVVFRRDDALVILGAPLAVLWAWCLHYTFRDTLNLVQAIGPVYYVMRDKEGTRWGISRGWMRQTDYPWLRGSGLQLDVPKRSLQIGLCRRRPVDGEEDGLLDVLDGRWMEANVKEISSW